MDNLFEREYLPYRHYHDLRTRNDLSYEVSNTSRAIEVPDESLRLLHVSHLMFTTTPRSPLRKPVSPTFTLTSAAAFMAMIHFNQRNELLVPRLTERLEGCDLYLTMDLLDSRISPLVASRQIIKELIRDHSLATPKPGSVVGAFSSTTTLPVATLTSANQIPHVGGIPAAKSFDNKDQYPTFARTVPTNDGHVAATIEVLHYLNVSHVGLLTAVSEYGTSFFEFFQQRAAKVNITVVGTPFDSRDTADIQKKCNLIRDSGFRYVVGVGDTSATDTLLEIAWETGIAGPGYQWITASMTGDQEVDATRTGVMSAFNGLISVELEIPGSRQFFGSLMGSMNDPEFTSFFVDSHPESFIWDDYAFNETPPAITRFAYTEYDAVMSVGISACETQARSFTGLEHYDQLTRTTFTGASGEIAFDPTTRTRKWDNLKYAVTSFHVNHEKSTNQTVVFSPNVAITIDFALDDPVVVNAAIRYADNSTTAPKPLPPVGDTDDNLIPQGIRIFGWVLAGLLVLLSIGFAAYTYRKRKTALIRASQPIFLGMLCLGTLIMASTIIPLSLQEPVPEEGLDIACKSIPWLYTLGFSTAFSALFSKAWRINKVVRNSVDMQRVQVHAGDVMWPFALLTITNVIILAAWTILAPLQWTRSDSQTDRYGRTVATYGSCSFGAESSKLFLLLLFIFNTLSVIFANYQSYSGRNNPTDFNESRHVAISMASLMECFLIGGPILLLVDENPEADFSVKTILIFVSCCSILLPMFLPKFAAQRGRNSVDDMHRSMRRIANGRARKSRQESSGDESSALQKINYFNSRSSKGSIDFEAVAAEQAQRTVRRSSQTSNSSGNRSVRRASHASNDNGLASSVHQLRLNALRSSIVTTPQEWA